MTYTYEDTAMIFVQRRHAARHILATILHYGDMDISKLLPAELQIVKHLELAGVVRMAPNHIDLLIADASKAAFLMQNRVKRPM